MTLLNHRLQTATLATLLTLTAGLGAQEDPVRQQPQPPTVSIAFPGGTLEQFIARMREADNRVNIVVSSMAADIVLPPLTLRDATVESALRAVGKIVPSEFQVAVATDQSPVGLPVHAVMIRSGPQNQATVGQGPNEPPREVVQVFSIRTITEALPNEPPDLVMDVKTVLTAIDTGLGIDPKASAATIRYHKESGLLFVRGTPTQINFIDDTLKSIARDLDKLRSAARRVPRSEARPGTPQEKEDR